MAASKCSSSQFRYLLDMRMFKTTKIATIITWLQGTFVAVFYCFFNGEVKTEVQKWWRIRNWKKSLPRGQNRRSSSFNYHPNGSSQTSGTFFSKREEKEIEIHNLNAPFLCSDDISVNTSDNGCKSHYVIYKPRVNSSLAVENGVSQDHSTSSLLSHSNDSRPHHSNN